VHVFPGRPCRIRAKATLGRVSEGIACGMITRGCAVAQAILEMFLVCRRDARPTSSPAPESTKPAFLRPHVRERSRTCEVCPHPTTLCRGLPFLSYRHYQGRIAPAPPCLRIANTYTPICVDVDGRAYSIGRLAFKRERQRRYCVLHAILLFTTFHRDAVRRRSYNHAPNLCRGA
jgi:hypothetical protein